MNQYFKRTDIVINVDTPASIKFSWLEKPEIMTCKVTKRHHVSENIFLQSTLIFIISFFFFFYMLFNKSPLIIVEKFENILLISLVSFK